jgi:hypothetical protein
MYIVRNGLPLLEWLGAPFLEHVGSGLLYTLLLSLLFLRHSQRSLLLPSPRHHIHLLLVLARVLSRVFSNLKVSGR